MRVMGWAVVLVNLLYFGTKCEGLDNSYREMELGFEGELSL